MIANLQNWGFELKNLAYKLNLKFTAQMITLGVLCVACGREAASYSNGSPAPNSSQAPNSGGSQETSAGSGKAGSTARFNVMNDKLYTITGGGIAVFDIASPEDPTRSGFSAVAEDIETLFNNGENLFVGAQSAMYVYSVAKPNHPVPIGIHRHARSCDPVVTQGEFAYVTLRSDNQNCAGVANVLKVIDIQVPARPRELYDVRLSEPYGLGIADTRLFVCDGREGLVEFYLSSFGRPKELSRVQDEFCHDVIPLEKTLITTGTSGISQYDIQESRLVRLSRIAIER